MAANDGYFPPQKEAPTVLPPPPKAPPNPIGCIPLKKRFLWPYKHPLAGVSTEDPVVPSSAAAAACEGPKPSSEDDASKAAADKPPPAMPLPPLEPPSFVLPPKGDEESCEGPSTEVRGLPLKYAMKRRLPGEGVFWTSTSKEADDDSSVHGALKVCRKKKIYNSTPMVNVNLPPRYLPMVRHMPSPRHVASTGYLIGTKYGSNVVVKRKRPTPWVPQKLKPPVRQSSRLRNKRAAKTYLAKMAASSPNRDGNKAKKSVATKVEEKKKEEDDKTQEVVIPLPTEQKSPPAPTVLPEESLPPVTQKQQEEEKVESPPDQPHTAEQPEETPPLPSPPLPPSPVVKQPEAVVDHPVPEQSPSAPAPPSTPPPSETVVAPAQEPVECVVEEEEEEEEGPLVIDEGPDEPPAPSPPPTPPPALPPSPPPPSPPPIEPLRETSNPCDDVPSSAVDEDPPVEEVVPPPPVEPPRERLSLKITLPKPKKAKRKKKSKSSKADREAPPPQMTSSLLEAPPQEKKKTEVAPKVSQKVSVKAADPVISDELPVTPKKKKGPRVVLKCSSGSSQWMCSLQTSPLLKKCKDCKVVLDRLPDRLLYMQPRRTVSCEPCERRQDFIGSEKEVKLGERKKEEGDDKKEKKKAKKTRKKKVEKKQEKKSKKERREDDKIKEDKSKQEEKTEKKDEAAKVDEEEAKEACSEEASSPQETTPPPPPPSLPPAKPKRPPKPQKPNKSKATKKPVPSFNFDLSNAKAKEPAESPPRSTTPAMSEEADLDNAASAKHRVPPQFARVMEADTDNSLNLIQEEFRGMKQGETRVIVLTKKQYDIQGKQAEILREFADNGVPKVEFIDVNHAEVTEPQKDKCSKATTGGGKFFSDFRKRTSPHMPSPVSRYMQKSVPNKRSHSTSFTEKQASKGKEGRHKSTELPSGLPKRTSNSWKKAVMDQIKLFKDPKNSDSENESSSGDPRLMSPPTSVPSSPLPVASPSMTSPRTAPLNPFKNDNYANQVAGWVSDISDDDTDGQRRPSSSQESRGFKIPSHPHPSPSAPNASPAEFRPPSDVPRGRRLKRQDSDVKSTPTHLSSSEHSEWECEMVPITSPSPHHASPQLLTDPTCFLNKTKAAYKAPPEFSSRHPPPLKKEFKSTKVAKVAKPMNVKKRCKRVKGKFRMEGKDDPTYMPGAPKDQLLMEESESEESADDMEPPPLPPPPPAPPLDEPLPSLSPADAASPFWKPGEPLSAQEGLARLGHSDEEQEQYEVSDEAFNARLYALYRHDRFKTRSGAKLRQIVDFTNVDWLERQQSSKGSSISLEDRELYSDDPCSPVPSAGHHKSSHKSRKENKKVSREAQEAVRSDDEGPPHLSPIQGLDAHQGRRHYESDSDYPKLDSVRYSDSASGMLTNLQRRDLSSASETEDVVGHDVPFQRTECKRRMKELYEHSKKCKRKPSSSSVPCNKRQRSALTCVLSDDDDVNDDDSAVHVASPEASDDDEFYSTTNICYRRQYTSDASDTEQLFLDNDLEELIRDAVTLSRDLEERLIQDPRSLVAYLDRMMQGSRTLCGDIQEQQQMLPPSSPPEQPDVLPSVPILQDIKQDDYGGLLVDELPIECFEDNSMDRLLSQPSGKLGCSPEHFATISGDDVCGVGGSDDFILGSFARYQDSEFATLGKYGELTSDGCMWSNVDSAVDLTW